MAWAFFPIQFTMNNLVACFFEPVLHEFWAITSMHECWAIISISFMNLIYPADQSFFWMSTEEKGSCSGKESSLAIIIVQ
jgi:hypothetical protein